MKDQKVTESPSFEEAQKRIKALKKLIERISSKKFTNEQRERMTIVVDEFQIVGQA
jgi:hypothetical protein